MKESENDFLTWIVEYGHLHHWLIAHFRPARISKNGIETWRTAVSADGKGFPDLVAVRGKRLVIAEVKSKNGRVSIEQLKWLDLLAATPAECYTWRPDDRPEIESVLK